MVTCCPPPTGARRNTYMLHFSNKRFLCARFGYLRMWGRHPKGDVSVLCKCVYGARSPYVRPVLIHGVYDSIHACAVVGAVRGVRKPGEARARGVRGCTGTLRGCQHCCRWCTVPHMAGCTKRVRGTGGAPQRVRHVGVRVLQRHGVVFERLAVCQAVGKVPTARCR